MALWSSKKLTFIILLAFLCEDAAAQVQTQDNGYHDYKDPKTHEKFLKRRRTVSAWQINQLKNGALVVRLKTNHLLISQLKKRGEEHLAEKARLEQAAVNVSMIKAYLHNYNFSKVYFIYSHSSDSLLNGTRSGIFIDTTLKVNPSITMPEKFYLIAEPDYIYNSSLGFVREDSARSVVEAGNPSSSEKPIVVKNKYGHQLKSPFPYAMLNMVFTKKVPTVDVIIDGKPYVFYVSSTLGVQRGNSTGGTYKVNDKTIELIIPKEMTYEVLSLTVEGFNASLNEYYKSAPMPSEQSVLYQDAKPFLY
jgi:hypothetical protein